jgi:predicted CoA-binding protein
MDMHSFLQPPKTVAIVGLSDNPERPSYQVGQYLKAAGFTIIPVNPQITEVFGLKAYPSVTAIPQEVHIDIVDVFRRADQVKAVIDDVVMSGRQLFIWLQEGVGTPEARTYAESHGFEIVMNLCIKKIHQALS